MKTRYYYDDELLSPSDQIDAEEWIAARIGEAQDQAIMFHTTEDADRLLSDDDLAQLGRDILFEIVARFAPEKMGEFPDPNETLHEVSPYTQPELTRDDLGPDFLGPDDDARPGSPVNNWEE